MKKQLLAILISLTLVAPVAAPAAILPVQAEEDTSEGEGSDEGSSEDKSEGSSGDKSEGADEGSNEGEHEGFDEGSSEDKSEGADEGSSEGKSEGADEGSSEGESEPTDNSATSTRYEHLSTALERRVYNQFAEQIRDTADGKRTTTEFSAELTEEEIDVLTHMSSDALTRLGDRIFDALSYDWTYDLYYDSAHVCYYDEGSHMFRLLITVAEDYRSGDELYVLDPDKVEEAREAFAQADDIVEEAYGMEVEEALRFFMDRLCSSVVYDHYAAEHSEDPSYRPYNIVNAFDLDPETNVVCAGYARGMYYLFRKWKEQNACDYDLYYVSSPMTDTAGQQPDRSRDHAWNILRGPRYNYLIDATSCDEDDGRSYTDDYFLKAPTRHTEEREGVPAGRLASYGYENESLSIDYYYYYIEKDGSISTPILNVYTESEIGWPIAGWDD